MFELLFPRRCVGCRKKWGTYLCISCLKQITYTQIQYCPSLSCGKPSLGGYVHTRCQTTFGLDGHVHAVGYTDIIKTVLEYYKRRHVRQVEFIIEQLFERYFTDEEDIFMLLPQYKVIVTGVPMFWLEQRQRGFNAAIILAKQFARLFNYAFNADLLQKTKPTRSQKDLSRKKRLQNLHGAFQVSKEVGLTNTVVFVVDDVWTTGATLQECSYTLKKAGAKEVWAITFARGI